MTCKTDQSRATRAGGEELCDCRLVTASRESTDAADAQDATVNGSKDQGTGDLGGRKAGVTIKSRDFSYLKFGFPKAHVQEDYNLQDM